MIPFVEYLGIAAAAVNLAALAVLYGQQRKRRRTERVQQIGNVICGKELL